MMADRYRRLIGKHVRAVVNITDPDDGFILYSAGAEGEVVAPEIDLPDYLIAVCFLGHDDPTHVARTEIAIVTSSRGAGG